MKVLFLSLLLAGCATSGKCPDSPVPPVSECPKMHTEYDRHGCASFKCGEGGDQPVPNAMPTYTPSGLPGHQPNANDYNANPQNFGHPPPSGL